MNKEVRDLTARVNDLQQAKESLESKVNSLEEQMDCVMGRRDSCSPTTCMNGGSLLPVSTPSYSLTDTSSDTSFYRPTTPVTLYAHNGKQAEMD